MSATCKTTALGESTLLDAFITRREPSTSQPVHRYCSTSTTMHLQCSNCMFLQEWPRIYGYLSSYLTMDMLTKTSWQSICHFIQTAMLCSLAQASKIETTQNNQQTKTKHKFNQVCWLDWYKPKYATLNMQPYVPPNTWTKCDLYVQQHHCDVTQMKVRMPKHGQAGNCSLANWTLSKLTVFPPTTIRIPLVQYWWNGPSQPNMNSLYRFSCLNTIQNPTLPFEPSRQKRPSIPYTHMSLQP